MAGPGEPGAEASPVEHAETLYEIAQLLGTGLSRADLAAIESALAAGVSPRDVAAKVRQLRGGPPLRD